MSVFNGSVQRLRSFIYVYVCSHPREAAPDVPITGRPPRYNRGNGGRQRGLGRQEGGGSPKKGFSRGAARVGRCIKPDSYLLTE
jgi:hypothetical protein